MAKFVIKKANTDYETRRWYFVLKADNNEILLASEMYNSKQAAKKGIAAIKKAVSEIVADDFDRADDIENVECSAGVIAQFPSGV